MKIHHIGYLVKHMPRARAAFEKLGFALQRPQVLDEIRKVYICFLEKDGYVIELISPVSLDSSVSGLIKQYRNAPYHICYSSCHFETDATDLSANGYTLVAEPSSAPAINDKRTAFFMSPAIGLIGLSEE